MKLRTGFVSNSSSSSFCIYGCCLPCSKVNTLIDKITENKEEPEYGFDTEEELSKLLPSFYIVKPDGSDEWFIGRTWYNIGDDETGKQFKESIEKQIKKVFGESTECGTHAEVYYC